MGKILFSLDLPTNVELKIMTLPPHLNSTKLETITFIVKPPVNDLTDIVGLFSL